jgi:hypothetical protein
LYEFMAWLERSALGHAMRESGVWTYAVVNLGHILGVASLFGSVVVLDLRLLGFWRKAPLPAITNPTVRVASVGFGLAVMTGICLLATKATDYVGNPFLYVKFPAIGLGLMNAAVLHFSPAWKEHRIRELSPREQSRLAVFGGISLVCWLTGITCGRMIGYW